MSETNAPTLNYDKAAQIMLDHVFAPTFFAKVAEYGFAPADEQEAAAMIQAANRLGYVEDVDQNKQAASRKGLLTRVNQKIDGLLGKSAQTLNDQAVKQAAVQLASNDVLRDAALLYQNGLQQLLARQ